MNHHHSSSTIFVVFNFIRDSKMNCDLFAICPFNTNEFVTTVCNEPMLDGESSTFAPSGSGKVGVSDAAGYSPVTIPKSGTLLLTSKAPAEITRFDIRANELCSEGGTLIVTISYFVRNRNYVLVSLT